MALGWVYVQVQRSFSSQSRHHARMEIHWASKMLYVLTEVVMHRGVYWANLMTPACSMGTSCGGGNTCPKSGQTAPGSPKQKRPALETAANLIQSKGPVGKISLYLDGFHASKEDPKMQMEAHHYCNQVNEDFAQCILFDGNNADSRLMGIEYIISAKLYNTLPLGEKAYWHPLNFEVLSGQLRLRSVPEVAEKEALKGKINSYGKPWHTWMTGMYDQRNDDLPLSPPRLNGVLITMARGRPASSAHETSGWD